MTASPRRQGLIFVLVGPAGVGKNALMNNVLNRVQNAKQFATATTRAPRPTEQLGREHLFVTRAEFQAMIDRNELIEWQVVHGELYGMPRATVEDATASGPDLMADIDVLGATCLRALYPDNAVLIFIQPPDVDELKTRMQKRGETPEQIAKRLQRVDMEMEYAPLCDYLITNDVFEDACEVLYALVLAERSRSALLNLRADRNLSHLGHDYVTSIIPLYGQEVLAYEGAPHFPTTRLASGECLYETAQRAMQQALSTNLPQPGGRSFHASLLLVALDTSAQGDVRKFEFVYLYLLPKRIAPPEGWHWMPFQQAELPPGVLDAIPHAFDAVTAERP